MSLRTALAFFLFPAVLTVGLQSSLLPAQAQTVLGYADFSAEAKLEEKFLAVPDPKLAGEELKTLTAEPHLAASPEDHKTAEYVAQKFRAAGLETQIVPYRVLLNWPKVVRVEAYDEAGHLLMSGPTREHVQGDPVPGRSARGDAVQRLLGFGRRDRRSGVRELRAARGLQRAGGTAHRPARQDCDLPLWRQLSRREGLPGRAARRHRRAPLFRPARTTATTKAMRIPSAPGGPRPACSAAQCNICSSIPAIPKLRAWPRPSTCPTLPASRTLPGPRATSPASSPFPSAITMRRRFCKR